MKQFLAFALVGLVIQASCVQIPTPRIRPVGAYDGKTYYVEDSLGSFTHEAADIECRRYNWRLVTLRSEGEYEYVRNLVPLGQRWWLSGKSAPIFKWHEGTGDVVDTIKFPVTQIHTTCLLFLGPNIHADPSHGIDDGAPYYPFCEAIIVQKNDDEIN